MRQRKKMKTVRPSSPTQSALVPLLAAILAITVFAVRWHVINQPHQFTFDESLYQELGYQLFSDPSHYSAGGVYEDLLAAGRNPPLYLRQPLFKHPPFFSYCIASCIVLLGAGLKAAYLPTVLSGALTIWVVFLLGRSIYNWQTGLAAAAMLSIDPIHWACSEKIWAETTQGFLCTLALYLFCRGLSRNHLLIWGGAIIGLALLTKYTSALTVLILVAFALIFRRDLLRNKYFWMQWLVAAAVFSPWAIWYFNVYGGGGGAISIGLEWKMIGRFFHNMLRNYQWAIPVLLIILGLGWFAHDRGRQNKGRVADHRYPPGAFYVPAAFIVLVTVLSLLCPSYMARIISPGYIPLIGWERNLFGGEPVWFYFARLPQFSPFYLFAFLGLVKILSRRKEEALLALYCLVILIFHSLWGNYQSRYILMAVPVLLIIASSLLGEWWTQIRRLSPPRIRRCISAVYVLVVLYFIAKTLAVALKISLPNNAAYF
ncbi:MAG: glycosyltransferase family 39 protein [Candidatus Aureabacteria bacterium]|nr:glycosyltransferase family 39 protein [Candidatus Auribacterota bacterium]